MAGRTLPDGRPVPDGAPDADILDQQDLRQIADALRAGKHVGLSSDGKVHVFDNTDGTPPIDAASETFVESKLGEVRSFLQQGFNVSINPDGRIWGHSADDKFKFQTDEVVALTDADRAEIRSFVASGADVAILPDGTLQFTQHPGEPTRTLREADAVMDFLAQETASGRLASEAAAGRGLIISGNPFRGEDLQPRYVQAPDIPGIQLPDPAPDDTTAGADGTDDPVPATSAAPPRSDAEEAQDLQDYAVDLATRARLAQEAAAAAARGDEVEANRLLEQSRIELVDAPADLVPEATPPTLVIPPTPRPEPDPPHVPTERSPSDLPSRPGRPAGEFDGPIGAVDAPADGTGVATANDGTGTGDITGAEGVAAASTDDVGLGDDVTGVTGVIGAGDIPASALEPAPAAVEPPAGPGDLGLDATAFDAEAEPPTDAPAFAEPDPAPVAAADTDFSSSSDFGDVGAAVDADVPADDLGTDGIDA